MFATYLRLHQPVTASNAAVIRAAIKKIDPAARHDRSRRNARHAFLRDMLDHHHDARDLARLNRL